MQVGPNIGRIVTQVKIVVNILTCLGWANAVPDAQANININILGSSLNFQGSGYHDKV